MTEDQGIAFLTALHAKHIRVKGNGWIEASCPLAPWTHKNHADHTPSFGLHIEPGGRSYFLCFSCRQGSAEELVAVLELYSKHSVQSYDFSQCHQILSDEEFVVPLPEYTEFGQPGIKPFVAWPSYWTESFIPAAWDKDAAVYLASRGVPVWQVTQFDLRYDPKRSMIVAPYKDVFGKLAGARGRSILAEALRKHHDYTYQGVNNSRLVWFNEPALDLPGPVVCVEGQFDCMRVVQSGFPKVVANLMAKPTREKLRKLGDCPFVVQIPDRDEAGEQSVERYAQGCHELGIGHKVLRLDAGVKDPAECHPDYLRERIEDLVR